MTEPLDIFYVENEAEITKIKKMAMNGGKHRSNIMVLMNHRAIIKYGEDCLTPIHAVCIPRFYRPKEGWSIDNVTLY